ncbi:Disease resistance protein (TIR-NBS-LRR class) family [Raphanus sativus]|nr:Disease resistance protein (TIR-NBS-LRR class) family [Raphanus sativus]
MALRPSSSSCCWRFHVFPSFHGPDVRVSFLSHLRKQFERNGIIMFNDQEIQRSQIIKPELTRAIQESRILIVVLSQSYASSSWCLNELVEILKCEETAGQIVMTIFYKVDPSDVRKQIGEFGEDFKKTCEGRTQTEIQSWTRALTHVANVEGEHSMNWVNEADMIEKIAKDVSDKLNATPSNDFDGMVGLEANLEKLKSLLHLEKDGAMIVGISGPAGIGKTTIARALYNQLSSNFPLRYFMENVRGIYRRIDCDQHGLKLHLQEQLLSKILNHDGMKIFHSDVVYERLQNQKVLIILDDVDHLEQLDALARDVSWFGHGSRIIVTTDDQELFKHHGIKNTYHVNLPSNEEALGIFSRYAFRQITPTSGFKDLAERVVELCCNLPLSLRVVGSSLRGKNEDEWDAVVHRLETNLDRDIERVLRVGYESLHENDQILFLYFAIFFNYKDSDHVKSMISSTHMDEKHGLNTLVNRSLIDISSKGKVVMHKLLQQVGRQVIHRQEPWKRQILMDAHEICDILEHGKGTRAVSGISFDTFETGEVFISASAFKRMPNLLYLSVHTRWHDQNDRVYIPEDMEFPPRLRLLHWDAYPSKSLPPKFYPEHLVELNMQESQLEKLWQGTPRLTNLKKMELMESWHLKELPDLSNATKLERLDLAWCQSLVEIPFSFSNLHKLKVLAMFACSNLQVLPSTMNLASLKVVNMAGCSRLRKFPDFSKNISSLKLSNTLVEEVPASIQHWTRLRFLDLSYNGKLKTINNVPEGVSHLNLSYSGIEKSLPELPPQLMFLSANDCESLESVSCPFYTPNAQLNFTNCFKLGEQARRTIIQQSYLDGWALLPGREVPEEFDHHRARGSSLTLPYSASSKFKICLVVAPNHEIRDYRVSQLLCRRRIGKCELDLSSVKVYRIPRFGTEHLFVFHSGCIEEDKSSSEIVFEFSSKLHDFEIVECGVQILTDQIERSAMCLNPTKRLKTTLF